jgi:putative peptidoglycan binding protein
MQHVTIRMALAAPLALLLGAAPALAQQAAPPTTSDPTGVERANETRELESEIEEYPGPTDGQRNSADPATRIPEAVEPAAPRPATSKPTANRSASSGDSARASGASMIDPSEVQRVFGSDTRLIALDSLDAATVTRMQARLQELGHYHGPVDGIAGPQTRAALGAYTRAQQALRQRLIEQNQLTTDLAEQLGVEPSTSQTMPRPMPEMGNERGAPTPRGDSPLSPRGAAPLPSPGMPSPTPSGAPPARGVPPAPGGVTPSAPPPSP